MICSNCGKEIKEGATYCLECGADIEAPVVLTDLKPKNKEEASKAGKIIEKKSLKEMVQYEGAFLDFSGYVKALGNDTFVLVGFFASMLVYLSPFFAWAQREIRNNKISSSLFEVGGKSAELSVDAGIIVFFAILVMLSGIIMLAFSGCSYIGPLKSFRDSYIIRLLPIVLSVIVLIIIINNKNYNELIDYLNKQEQRAEKIGAGYNYSGGMGVGPVMLIIGQVLYGVSVALDYAKRKK